MLTRTLTAALALSILAGARAMAQQPEPRPVRFAEELGFKDFLSREPEQVPGVGGPSRMRMQRPLYDVSQWKERTFEKFAVHVSASEYYFGANFGRNLIGRFYRSGFGTEVTAYLHVDRGVDMFLAFGYGWHEASRGEILDEAAKLSDYESYELIAGVRPFIGLGSLLGGDTSLDSIQLNCRLGLGPAYMDAVERIRPSPSTPFWEPAALGAVHLSVGLEIKLLAGLSLFLDHGLRLYSPPAPAASARPGNETGPFFYALWQAGFFLRF